MNVLSRTYNKLIVAWIAVLDAERQLEIDWEYAWLDWATDGFRRSVHAVQLQNEFGLQVQEAPRSGSRCDARMDRRGKHLRTPAPPPGLRCSATDNVPSAPRLVTTRTRPGPQSLLLLEVSQGPHA